MARETQQINVVSEIPIVSSNWTNQRTLQRVVFPVYQTIKGTGRLTMDWLSNAGTTELWGIS